MGILNQCGVYAIHVPSGELYIGSSVKVKKRWSEHQSRIRNRYHYNALLQKAADTFGIENLVCRMVLICSKENLRFFEQIVIDALEPKLNVLPTAEHFLGEQWKRDEFRERNRKRASEQNKLRMKDPEYVKGLKERAVYMNTEASKNKATETRRRLMAERGDAYRKAAKIASKTLKMLHKTSEFADKHSNRMKDLMIAKCKDKEFCKRRDAAAEEANKKPIKLLNTGEIFPSKNEAAIALGISVSLITKQLRGLPTKTGYQWEFL